jgi:uncharacterized protein (DUF2141 family)
MKKKTPPQKKVKTGPRYILTITRDLNGNTKLNHNNNGFGIFEVIGLLTVAQNEVIEDLKPQPHEKN